MKSPHSVCEYDIRKITTTYIKRVSVEKIYRIASFTTQNRVNGNVALNEVLKKFRFFIDTLY